MNSKNLHVVISIDKNRQNLELNYCESENELLSLDSSMKIIDFELEKFIDGDDERAISTIGETVLGIFESLVDGGIGFEISESLGEAEIQAENILKDFAKKGDAASKFALGMTYLQRSEAFKNIKLLDEAEHWFKESAEDGYEEALKYFNYSWATIKQETKERIAKNIAKKVYVKKDI